MSNTVVFHHNPMSRGRVVHLMLEEVGAPYRVVLHSFDKREHKTPEYLAINPMGKIPAIEHRGVVVTEAAAICAYLADAFPAAKLAPALDDPARGTYFRWLFFASGCGDPALMDRQAGRDPIPLGPYGTYEDMVSTLEKAVARGPYILGDRFTAADVYVGSLIGFGLMRKTLEPRPAFLQYAGRIAERPAFQRVQQQAEEMAKKIA